MSANEGIHINADAQGVSFQQSLVRNGNFRNANLVSASFFDGDLTDADFTGADMSQVNRKSTSYVTDLRALRVRLHRPHITNLTSLHHYDHSTS